jgi:hypothetical protein
VLAVAAPDSAALLADVRAADPAGRYAMAVAYDTTTRTLAVDTTRLVATMRVSPAYGLPDAAELARRLRPTAPVAPRLHDGPLDVDLGASGRDSALRLTYADPAGQAYTVELGPLAAGRGVYRAATVSGCAAGCRLVSFEPVSARPSATVSVYGVNQGDAPAVADGAVLGDIRFWRSQLGPNGVGPLIAAGGGRLDITVTSAPAPRGKYADHRVYYAGVPVPLPVVLAGPDPTGSHPGDPRITALGGLDVPYEAVARARVLPRAGASGALMDLEYAQDSIGLSGESVTLEVWLSADAPPAVLRALRTEGVVVLSDTDLAATTAALARHGSGVALRFQLFVAAVVLLLATGSLVVAVAVAHRDRAAELRALRGQGLASRAMRRAGYAATVPVVVAAVLIGVASALIAQWSVASSLPVFPDDWDVLPRPGGAGAAAIAVAVGAAVLALVPPALLGTARMVRAVDRSPRRESR